MPRDFFGNYPIVAGLGFSRDIKVLDDCEGTFTWTVGGTGGDDVHEFLAAAAWQGTYGMHLKTRTTDTDEDDALAVQKLFDFPVSIHTRLRAGDAGRSGGCSPACRSACGWRWRRPRRCWSCGF